MIKLAARFVAAADEVWRLQRNKDPDCLVFQSMADHGHYRGVGGTRQGIYVCSPAGKLLASANVLEPKQVIEVLRRGLDAWDALPDEQRRLPPGTSLEPRHCWEDSYPNGGLVLVTVSRDLPPDREPTREKTKAWNRDHAWFTIAEGRAWLPVDPLPGAVHAVPEALIRRLARFHLLDNVRGQTLPFAVEEVVDSEMRTRVVSRDGDLVRLRISGNTRAVALGPWLLGQNDWTPSGDLPRGVITQLIGRATYDLGRGAFTEFEIVAVGWRWGGTVNNGRRGSDNGPIGIAMSLAPEGGARRVPPGFIGMYAADWVIRPAK